MLCLHCYSLLFVKTVLPLAAFSPFNFIIPLLIFSSKAYPMITDAEFLGKFFTVAIKKHTMENWSSFHFWFLKACSQVIPLQYEAPRNCIDKTLSEKKRWNTYLKRWGKGERRGCKQHWNSSQWIHQSKEAKSHGTHQRKRNILVPTQSSKHSLWKPREKVLKATGLREFMALKKWEFDK